MQLHTTARCAKCGHPASRLPDRGDRNLVTLESANDGPRAMTFAVDAAEPCSRCGHDRVIVRLGMSL